MEHEFESEDGPQRSQKREAVITVLTTPELARHAFDAIKTDVKKHDLSSEFEAYWCHEKVDTRGNRANATGRAARPMINVQDGAEENSRKNRQEDLKSIGKTKRASKNTRADGTRTTYTKYLGTHVMLYAKGRQIPRPGFHASHLCHNERCVRDSHLRVENEALNQQRKGCAGVLVCSVCGNKWQAL